MRRKKTGKQESKKENEKKRKSPRVVCLKRLPDSGAFEKLKRPLIGPRRWCDQSGAGDISLSFFFAPSATEDTRPPPARIRRLLISYRLCVVDQSGSGPKRPLVSYSLTPWKGALTPLAIEKKWQLWPQTGAFFGDPHSHFRGFHFVFRTSPMERFDGKLRNRRSFPSFSINYCGHRNRIVDFVAEELGRGGWGIIFLFFFVDFSIFLKKINARLDFPR